MRMSASGLGRLLLLQALMAASVCPPAVGGQSFDPRQIHASEGAEAVACLVTRLWDSGFFQKCDLVRDEILDNDYAFFGAGSSGASFEKKGMACFSQKRGRKDTIYLREDILAHFKVAMEGVFERRSVEPTVLKVLVHELCHDFWANILEDSERAYFAMDGEELIADYRRALTAEDKRRFLLRAGQHDQDPRRSRFLADFEDLLATYRPGLLAGPELFVWFGERAYAGTIEIPPSFRKYYAGIVAAAAPPRLEPLS
jgi:hypothetical protein